MSATNQSATMKGPAIFLAQFIGNAAPFNSFDAICGWAAGLGYKGVQVPTSDPRMIDLDKAAVSQTYCDEITGMAASHGLAITELSTHLQGQLVAVHPAYNEAFDAFAPPAVRGKPNERQRWAVDQMKKAAQASRRLGLAGGQLYRRAGLAVFLSLAATAAGPDRYRVRRIARRWRPILDAYEDAGVDLCYEIHPGEDICDGITFEMFLRAHRQSPALRASTTIPRTSFCSNSTIWASSTFTPERIRAFHVKDAEFNPTGRQGVYSGFQPWINRAGRFRSLGDGQVDFKAIFSRLAAIGFDRWAVLEWPPCLRMRRTVLREGAAFIREHVIRVTERAFRRLRRRHQRRCPDPTDIGPHLSTNKSTGVRYMAEPRIRLGTGGGGEGAFIGAVHRIAARLDDRYELVAGALSASPDKAIGSAAAIGLGSDRSYPDFRTMARAEAGRTDAIEAVAIVTPNHMHAPVAAAFLETGVDIICDKPLTTTLGPGVPLARQGKHERTNICRHL